MFPDPFRLDAIDSAKGIGILLVVFGHAWRGAHSAGLLADEALFQAIDFAVYAFHMPLFFFLSGLLFLETLGKYTASTSLKGRLTRLLWPMVLWSWIFFGLKLAAGSSANTPVTLADFPIIPLPPFEHLWFLWALFLCQTLLVFGYVAGGGCLPATRLRWLLAAGALLFALVNPYISVPSLLWGPMFEHLPYFLAGIAAGGILSCRMPLWAGFICTSAFAALVWAVQGEKASVLHSLGLIAFGWGAWLCADRGVGAGQAHTTLRFLRAIGQASMAIYLTHTVFAAGLRIILLKSGVENVSVILLATVVIGIIAPVAMGRCAQRLRLTKLLGF